MLTILVNQLPSKRFESEVINDICTTFVTRVSSVALLVTSLKSFRTRKTCILGMIQALLKDSRKLTTGKTTLYIVTEDFKL